MCSLPTLEGVLSAYLPSWWEGVSQVSNLIKGSQVAETVSTAGANHQGFLFFQCLFIVLPGTRFQPIEISLHPSNFNRIQGMLSLGLLLSNVPSLN